MDAAAVRALAGSVLDGADRLDEIRWATVSSADLPGSAVLSAAACHAPEDRLADLVAHMRTWAAAAGASAEMIGRAEADHTGRLGAPR